MKILLHVFYIDIKFIGIPRSQILGKKKKKHEGLVSRILAAF